MRRLFFIATLTALSGCGTEPDRIHLDLALDKSVISTGDSVRLTLTLTNFSRRTLQVVAADAYGFCMHAFQAFDAQGREVSVPTGLCVAIQSLIAPKQVDLAPGQGITITDWWNPAVCRVAGQPLLPGVYRLNGRATGDNRAINSEGKSVTLLP